MEREVGGGIGMGNTCKPMAVSFQCMTKSTIIKKKRERRKKNAVAITAVQLLDGKKNKGKEVVGSKFKSLQSES